MELDGYDEVALIGKDRGKIESELALLLKGICLLSWL